MTKEMIEQLPWDEFRDSGLLWFVNRTLHLFGRAICFEYDDAGRFKQVYYARCKFRSFDQKSEEKGFSNIYKFINNNISEIEKDLEE